MAIKISGTTVIDDSRNVTDVENVGDANTVYTGDGSNLTGIQVGSSSFTASGAISNGTTVILNSDGTVSAVTTESSDVPIIGSTSTFHSPSTTFIATAYDPDEGKVIICYRDNVDNYGRAVVGTVSGSDITFGTEVTFNSSSTQDISLVYDTNSNRALVSYPGGSSYGTSRVLSISGNSITVGSATAFHFGSTGLIRSTFDSSNNKVVIVYRDTASGNRGRAIVATINASNNTVSFGSEATWIDDFCNNFDVTFDSTNNKVVICGGFTGASGSKARAYVGTVSGTSITFGTPGIFSNSGLYYVAAAFDSTNGKVVIVFQDPDNSSYMAGIVGTVSGTGISFGSVVVINSVTSINLSAAYDSNNGKIVAVTGTASKVYMGTVSGTSITFDGGSTYDSNNSTYTSVIFDTTNNISVISYRKSSNSGASVVVDNTGTNATDDNFIGIAAEAISNGSSGSITIVTGINESQTGLTTGQQYFVQRDGTIDTTADTPSLLAGTAISATKLIVKR